MKKLHEGFTLIELIVVMAIIGVLISLAVIGLEAAKRDERDTARKHLASQINTQLQAWFDKNGAYPTALQFYGFGAAYFLDPTQCSNGYHINGVCTDFEGIALQGKGVQAYTGPGSKCVTPVNMDDNDIYLCYEIPGSSGSSYSLYVYTETGSTITIAQ